MNKYLLLSNFLLFGIVIGVLVVKQEPPVKKTASVAAVDSMASHHAPSAPAETTKFNSLLNNPAPEFSLVDYGGKTVSLASFRGKNLVVFFSEGAMCYPSCWEQIDAFTKDKSFNSENTSVLTIVVDPKADWAEAVKKDKTLAKAMVLLDTDRKVSSAYGVLTLESSMHRGQYPGHTYVVIDKEGVVRYELDDPNMRVNNSQLLTSISALK